VAYGIRKALQAEQKKAEMQIKINQVRDHVEDLESEIDQLTV